MRLKKLISLLLVLCMALACASCGSSAPTATVAPTTQVTETPAPEASTADASAAEDDVEDEDEDETDTEESEDIALAYVNGNAVMLSEVSYYADYLYEQYGYDDDTTEDEIRALYETALNYAMSNVIMRQKADELGYTALSDDELAELKTTCSTEWNEMVLYYAEAYFGYTDGGDATTNNEAVVNTLSFLESYGYTEEVLLQDYVDNAWYEKLVAYICQGVSVTDEDAYSYFLTCVEEDKTYYEDNAMLYEFYTQYYGYTSWYVPSGYRGVKQILLSVDEDLLNTYLDLAEQLEDQEGGEATATDLVTADAVEAARLAVIASVQPTIDDIKARLAAGESFDSLIALYNTDPGMTAEPEASQGYSVHQDSIMYDEPFVNAAFSVSNIGDVSEPYVGSYGIYIVQYFRDVPEGAVEYTDEVRTEMLESVQEDRENEAVNAQVESWLAEADIIYTAAAEDYLPYADATVTDVN